MNKRPTLVDVARAAGVSKTTASMAVNGTGLNKIPEATRKRVLAAAEALNFRPHGVARALGRRRADVLGVVCTVNPFIELAHHAFEHTLLSAVFYHALEQGYNSMIYGGVAEEAEERALFRYADGRSDAFIVLYPPPDCALLKFLCTQHLPVVALCCQNPHAPVCWVDSDHEAGIRAAITHLAELGHRRIAYLLAPEVEDEKHTRLLGFRRTMQEYNIPVREEWILPYMTANTSMEEQIERLWASSDPPTALLTWNDFAATEVVNVLHRRGLRIPEDVSILGFDDTPSARLAVPALTTVRQDVVQMGRAAVDLAIGALCEEETPRVPRSVLCPVQLIVRQSTAPPGQRLL